MDLKTVEIDGKTFAEVKDGKPVYVDGGTEIAFDAVQATAKIKDLGREAKGHREAKEAAEAALKGFEGLDAEAARKALETVQGLDAGKLTDAEKAAAERRAAVEAAVKEWQTKAQTAEERAATAERQLHGEKIGGSFARSRFIADKLAVPVPMVEKTFGDHFAIEGGKIVAKDANGNQLYSRANPGEPADFDEALQMLVEASPFRDSIMKGTGNSGTGARGGTGGGAKTISRAEFETVSKSDPGRAASLMSEGYTLTD